MDDIGTHRDRPDRNELEMLDNALARCRAIVRPVARIGPQQSATVEMDRALIEQLLWLSCRVLSGKRSLTLGIEALRDGFAVFDREGKLTHANRSFRSFFGHTIRAEAGVRLDHLLSVVLAHGLVVTDGMAADEWKARFSIDKDNTQDVTLKDGRVLRWMLRLAPGGELVVLTSDLTRDIRRQQELDIARRQAEAAAEAKTQFLAQMSHEFRTPMNGVIGMAELLCDSGLDGEHQRFAETIRSSAEALLSLINGILDFARGRGQGDAPVHSAFDLEALAVEVVTLLQPVAREKRLHLRLFYDPMLPTCWIGDSGRIRQVMLNLIGNAIKYTQSGWIRLQIIGGADVVHVLVHDSGPGIPDENCDDIFQEFNRLDADAHSGVGGTGLGLPITAQIVESLRGHLWLSSTPGEGSTFGVRLPLRPARTPDHEPPFLPGTSAHPASDVLVALDGQPIGNHVQRVFSGAGIAVTLCRSPADLPASLSAGAPPQLVLLCRNDTADLAAEVRLVRSAAPGARIWLLLPASVHCNDRDILDRMVQLPVPRASLTEPIRELLANTPPPSQRRVLVAPSEDPSDAPGNAPPRAPSARRGSTAAAGETLPRHIAPERRMRVLIVDDNATNRLVIQKMLRHCDIEMMMAENGQEAVWTWRARKPDLILMDLSMPQLDGREATRLIRRIEAAESLAPTPIVAVTAAVDETDRTSVLAAGMDAVMTKPVRRTALIEELVRAAPPHVRPPVPRDSPPASPQTPSQAVTARDAPLGAAE